jgi:hypothetical protein
MGLFMKTYVDTHPHFYEYTFEGTISRECQGIESYAGLVVTLRRRIAKLLVQP